MKRFLVMVLFCSLSVIGIAQADVLSEKWMDASVDELIEARRQINKQLEALGWKEQIFDNDSEEELANDSNTPQEFIFRNGITWGMREDEVFLREKAEFFSDQKDGELSNLLYFKAIVSKYTGSVVYVFKNNKLQSTHYAILNNIDSDFDYIASSLSEIYGEPVEIDKDRMLSFSRIVHSGFKKADENEFIKTPLSAWRAIDGTMIVIFQWTFDKTYNYIFYISPAWYDEFFTTENLTNGL